MILKKMLSLCLFYLALAFFVNAQNTIGNVASPSPNAASVGKYGETNMNLANGTANVSIPLFNLQDGFYSFPVGLSYRTTPMRPDEHPGWVGMGWTLGAGGVISRQVQGTIDEESYDVTTTINGQSQGTDTHNRGYLYNYSDLNTSNWDSDASLESYQDIVGINTNDTEPDVFTFSFHGIVGTFFLGADGEWHVASDPTIKIEVNVGTGSSYPQVQENPVLTNGDLVRHTVVDKAIKGFKITLGNGYIYYFGSFGGHGNENAIESSFDFNSPIDIDNTNDAWHLTEITNPHTDDVVTFKYFKDGYNLSLYKEIMSSKSPDNNDWEFSPRNLPYVPGLNNCYGPEFKGSYLFGRIVSPSYLQSVITPYYEVLFQSSESLQLEYDYERISEKRTELIEEIMNVCGEISSTYNFFQSSRFPETGDIQVTFWTSPIEGILTRESAENGTHDIKYRQLNSVIFKDKLSGSTIKTFSLNYDNGSEERLRLASVKDNCLPPYSFEYEEGSQLPSEYFSPLGLTDHWGHYNGRVVPNISPCQDFLDDCDCEVDEFHECEPGDPIYDQCNYLYENCTNGLGFYYDASTVNEEYVTQHYSRREPSFEHLQANILKKVIYPTSASTSFEYEPLYYDRVVTRSLLTGEDAIAGPLDCNLLLETCPCDEIQPDCGCNPGCSVYDYCYQQYLDCQASQQEGDTPFAGLRVSAIVNDPGSEPVLRREFTYETGILGGEIQYLWRNFDSGQGPVDRFVSRSIFPVSTTHGSVVSYSRVTETQVGIDDNGYTTTEFTNFDTHPDDSYRNTTEGQVTAYTVISSNAAKRGLPLRITAKDASGNTVREVVNSYEEITTAYRSLPAIKVNRMYIGDSEWSVEATAYDLHIYPYRLTSASVSEYGLEGAGLRAYTKTYNYNPGYALLNYETISNWDGIHKTVYFYPAATNEYSNLHEIHILSTPVVVKKYLDNTLASGRKLEYNTDALPIRDYEILHTGEELLRGTINQYNEEGLPLDYTAMGELTEYYDWQDGLLMSKKFGDWEKSYSYYTSGHRARMMRSKSEYDGQSVSYDYDDCRRLFKEKIRGGGVTTIYGYGVGAPSTLSSTTTFTDATPTQSVVKTFDGFGRLVSHFTNGVITALHIYDDLGRIIRTDDPIAHTDFVHELSPLNRLTEEHYVDDTKVTYEYLAEGSLMGVARTNEKGFVTTSWKDVLGRLKKTKDQENNFTNYWYDFRGNLDKVTLSIGPPYRYTYDARNRMTESTIPDGGTTEYCYTNVSDRLCSMTDGDGNTLYYLYDQYGRETDVYWSYGAGGGGCADGGGGGSLDSYCFGGDIPANADPVISNTYDTPTLGGNSKTRVTKRVASLIGADGQVTTLYGYDGFGRVILEKESTQIDGDQYANSRTVSYNLADWVTKTSVDGVYGAQDQYRHNNFGQVIYHQSTNEHGGRLVTTSTYNDAQQPTITRFGGGPNSFLDVQAYSYNDRGWLTDINSVTEELIVAYTPCGEPLGESDISYTSEEEVTPCELLELITEGHEVTIEGLDPCDDEVCEVGDYSVAIPLWDNDIPYFPCTLRYQTGMLVDKVNTVSGTIPLDLTILYHADDAVYDDHANNNYDLFGPNFAQDPAIVELRNSILLWLSTNGFFVQDVVISLGTDNRGEPLTINIDIRGSEVAFSTTNINYHHTCWSNDRTVATPVLNENTLTFGFTPSNVREIECSGNGDDPPPYPPVCTVPVKDYAVDFDVFLKEDFGKEVSCEKGQWARAESVLLTGIYGADGSLVPLNYPFEFTQDPAANPDVVRIQQELSLWLNGTYYFDEVAYSQDPKGDNASIKIIATNYDFYQISLEYPISCVDENTGTVQSTKYLPRNAYFRSTRNLPDRPCIFGEPGGNNDQDQSFNDILTKAQNLTASEVLLPTSLNEVYGSTGRKEWLLDQELGALSGEYTVYHKMALNHTGQLFEYTDRAGQLHAANLNGLLTARSNSNVDQLNGIDLGSDALDDDGCNTVTPSCSPEEQIAQEESLAVILQAQQDILNNCEEYMAEQTGPICFALVLLCDGSTTTMLCEMTEYIEGDYTVLDQIEVSGTGSTIVVNVVRNRALFAMHFNHEDNGNISQVKWKVTNHMPKQYDLAYWPTDRLLEAQYSESWLGSVGSMPTTEEAGNYTVEKITYDEVGSIMSLTRHGMVPGKNDCLEPAIIDELQMVYPRRGTYDYTTDNVYLDKVLDGLSENHADYGFPSAQIGVVPELPAYEYDGNGSIISDPYRGISMEYKNFLNLPTKIEGEGGVIKNVYDATGRKIRTTSTITGEYVVQDYIGAALVVDDKVESAMGAGGRFVFEYEDDGDVVTGVREEYHHLDHLGNTRLAFSDLDGDRVIELADNLGMSTVNTEIMQENHYYPFGMNMAGYWYSTVNPVNDYQYNGIEFEESLNLNFAYYRTLDPTIGRWMQIDPKAEFLYSITPYNSMMNNPMFFNDPNGDIAPVVVAGIVGGIIGAAGNIYDQYRQGNLQSTGDWIKAGVVGAGAGAVGAVVGTAAIMGAAAWTTGAVATGVSFGGTSLGTTGFFSGAFSGALSGAVSNPLRQAGNMAMGWQNTFSGDSWIMDTVLGFGIGGVFSGFSALLKGQNFWWGNSQLVHGGGAVVPMNKQGTIVGLDEPVEVIGKASRSTVRGRASQIQRLLDEARIDRVHQILNNLDINGPAQNDLISILSQYNSVKNDFAQGIVSREAMRIAKEKFRQNLYYFIEIYKEL
jgi:RHS repeat-associated protein